MIVKKNPGILHFEVIDVIHAKYHKLINQIYMYPGNLEKHRYLPWFKGCYGVHVGVNGKGGGGGENGYWNGYGNGESGPAGTERGR